MRSLGHRLWELSMIPPKYIPGKFYVAEDCGDGLHYVVEGQVELQRLDELDAHNLLCLHDELVIVRADQMVCMGFKCLYGDKIIYLTNTYGKYKLFLQEEHPEWKYRE